MSAVPDLLHGNTGDADVMRPFPNSRKIHVPGSRPDIAVPMREIACTPTPTAKGPVANESIVVYDSSGPYTDPKARIDFRHGLAALRSGWVEERNDTVQLERLTSALAASVPAMA